ncbi:hypothetical protein [Mucilaginibacter sp.]|uniref:hypothetical protein n=1 Tax=Mucilaginibacter sp. TaxID=1882438 RepID=UPI0032647D43
MGPTWEATTLCLVLFAINVGAIGITQLFYRGRTAGMVPGYFSKVVALSAAGCITVSIVTGIFDSYNGYADTLWIALLALVLVYGFAVSYSLKNRSLYYLCIIPLSIIIIISSWLFKVFARNSGGVFFFVSLFVIISITVLVNALITLNKSWNGNK